MKKFLIVLIILVVAGIGAYLGWSISKNGKIEVPFAKPKFIWGVTVNQTALGKYSTNAYQKELDLVNQLGASWIRINFDFDATGRDKIYTSMVDRAKEKNINVYVALESSGPIEELNEPYADGAQVGATAAKLFKDKVSYYQILNEQGGMTIKGGEYGGEQESDYDLKKYEKVKEWTKGAVSALRENDSKAKVVITAHWTHTAYVDMILRDKIDFDILGWDWYADMGLMNEKKLTDGTLLVDKLRSYKKPIILAEVNGTASDEQDAQANFVTDMAEWAYNSGFIKGFFVHELTDSAEWPGRKANFFGLVKVKKIPGGTYSYDFGDPKDAFYSYQQIISKYSK